MKKIYVLFFPTLFCSVLQAQVISFQRTFGGTRADYAVWGQQTSEGGFIVAGSTNGTNTFGFGSMDVCLVKTDSSGIVQWEKIYGGTNDEHAGFVQQTKDGGFVITGYTSSFGDSIDVYLLKTDSDGNLFWSKTFGGTGAEYASSVQQTSDGGFIIAGSTSGFGAGANDVYLVKTDSNGFQQWMKAYGGTANDYASFAQQTNDGGFIVAGFTYSFSQGYDDVYILKTSSNGTLQWSKTFGSSGYDEGYSIQPTNDGGFIIGGMTTSFGAGYADMYILKTTSTGNLQWSKTFGGIQSEDASWTQQTNDGGFIIGGSTTSFGAGYHDIYLVKTASDGSLQWSKTFGTNDDDVGSVDGQTNDGGFFISGGTWFYTAQNEDLYLVRTDANGNTGCNQTNPSTLTGVPSTIVANAGTLVTPGGIGGIPATQTDSGGATEKTFCYTGVDEIEKEDVINIYPNPTSGIFTIQIGSQQSAVGNEYKTEIYNVFGEKVTQSVIPNAVRNLTIDISNQPQGIYFLQVKTAEGTAVKKIIVQL
ncbi:MAG: T9SS type A sorting domain-containing protein [Bacteroidetes bacterium]|nr:T9SS type A sorting domain-containing protein [Bacteroidota bacterium]